MRNNKSSILRASKPKITMQSREDTIHVLVRAPGARSHLIRSGGGGGVGVASSAPLGAKSRPSRHRGPDPILFASSSASLGVEPCPPRHRGPDHIFSAPLGVGPRPPHHRGRNHLVHARGPQFVLRGMDATPVCAFWPQTPPSHHNINYLISQSYNTLKKIR